MNRWLVARPGAGLLFAGAFAAAVAAGSYGESPAGEGRGLTQPAELPKGGGKGK